MIDREELQKVMKSLNEELSEDELNAMIREADVCYYYIWYKLFSGRFHTKRKANVFLLILFSGWWRWTDQFWRVQGNDGCQIDLYSWEGHEEIKKRIMDSTDQKKKD